MAKWFKSSVDNVESAALAVKQSEQAQEKVSLLDKQLEVSKSALQSVDAKVEKLREDVTVSIETADINIKKELENFGNNLTPVFEGVKRQLHSLRDQLLQQDSLQIDKMREIEEEIEKVKNDTTLSFNAHKDLLQNNKEDIEKKLSWLESSVNDGQGKVEQSLAALQKNLDQVNSNLLAQNEKLKKMILFTGLLAVIGIVLSLTI